MGFFLEGVQLAAQKLKKQIYPGQLWQSLVKGQRYREEEGGETHRKKSPCDRPDFSWNSRPAVLPQFLCNSMEPQHWLADQHSKSLCTLNATVNERKVTEFVSVVLGVLLYLDQCSGWQAVAWTCPAGSSPAPSWVALPMRSGPRCEPPVGWWDELGATAASVALSELWRNKQKKKNN